MNANKAKVTIGILSFLVLILSILIKNEIVSAVLVLICALAAIGILYRHLPELSNVSADNPKVKTLRFITVFNVFFVVGLFAFAILAENEIIKVSDKQTAIILPAIFAVIMLVLGNAAPKIPHNRYTGLRLPWTVNDEETWVVAHRILGYISIPCGILCFAGVGNEETAVIIPIAMFFLWILIPAVLSYIFFRKKWHSKK